MSRTARRLNGELCFTENKSRGSDVWPGVLFGTSELKDNNAKGMLMVTVASGTFNCRLNANQLPGRKLGAVLRNSNAICSPFDRRRGATMLKETAGAFAPACVSASLIRGLLCQPPKLLPGCNVMLDTPCPPSARSILFLVCCVLSLSTASALAQDGDTQDDAEAQYTRVINERSAKIVEPMKLANSEQAARVRQLIAQQYRSLRDLDAKYETQTNEMTSGSDRESRKDEIEQIQEIERFRLHRTFVATLSVELTPEQLEQVKDGMTYGVVPNTYAVYLEMHPAMKPAEKKKILAYLREAREYAMDAGSSEAKHAWFRKYKGKINNFLSAAGY